MRLMLTSDDGTLLERYDGVGVEIHANKVLLTFADPNEPDGPSVLLTTPSPVHTDDNAFMFDILVHARRAKGGA